MNNKFYQDFRGSMKRFDPITPEQVEKESEGIFTYAELAGFLQKRGLSIENVIYDRGRAYLNTYYADYEKGLYITMLLNGSFITDCASFDAELGSRRADAIYLKDKDWKTFYMWSVPLPMQIYDFQRRMQNIEPEKVFEAWLYIYTRMDYPNNQWTTETLDYVFSRAPAPEKIPESSEDGMVTVYRGMGELSQPPETALSWSANPGNALWFANHSARGTALVKAKVAPKDIVAFRSDYYNENEIIVRPGTVRNIQYEDMFRADQETFMKLAIPALPDYIRYGKQAEEFGYGIEGIFEFHGCKHVLRVLLLSLIYYCGSGDAFTEADKDILIYFSLLHDVGRVNDNRDEQHGALSVDRIRKENLRVGSISLTKRDYRIAQLIIQYHCLDDETGIKAIRALKDYSRKDKERMIRLYQVCKDMDGLDRVRFNGLDYRLLRTDFAKKLPLIAGCLLQEDVFSVLAERAE